MPRPKASPNAYRDVLPMLEAALLHSGARFECGTRENAIRTVQRMNQFRLLDRRRNFEMHKAEGPRDQTRERWEFDILNMKWHVSAFDDLIIRRPTSSIIVIDCKPDRPFIEAFDTQGNRIEVGPTIPSPLAPSHEIPQKFVPVTTEELLRQVTHNTGALKLDVTGEEE